MAINGISSGDSGNYFASMFGTKSATKSDSSSGLEAMLGSSASGMSGIGDYAMIQNGAYKKLLNAYYNKKETGETAEQKTEKLRLTTSSADANGLSQDVGKLMNINISEDNRESIKDTLKSVIEKYNTLIDSASKVDNVAVLRQALWMTQDTAALAKSLTDVGITVGSDNKLSLNESKLDSAQLSSLNTIMKGRGSYFSKLADRAAALTNAASNAVSGSNSKSTYNAGGGYDKQISGNVVDTAE